jgi:hypothetical protein
MDVALAIIIFLFGMFTNEVWRSILSVGLTVNISKETIYQTFKVAKAFSEQTDLILAFQYKAMAKSGMTDEEIKDVLTVNSSALSIWKQAMFDSIMAECPLLVKDHFRDNLGWSSFDSIFDDSDKRLDEGK